MDLVSLVAGSVLGVTLRLGPEEISEYVYHHMEGWLLFCGCILLANYLSGSYRLQYMFSRFNLVVTWLFSLVFTLFILSLTSYAWITIVLGRGVLVLSILFYSVLSLFMKLLVYRHLFRSNAFLCRVAIVGTGERAKELRKVLEHELVLPAHKVVAFVRVWPNGDTPPEEERLMDNVAVVDVREEHLDSVLKSLGVKLVVVGFDHVDEGLKLYPRLSRLRFESIEVMGPLTVAEVYTGRTPVDLLNEEIVMQLSMDCEFPMVARAKRVFDLLAAIVGIVACLPLVLLVALALKLADASAPVFYVQKRVGQFGKVFTIVKFRTMIQNAEDETGAVWSCDKDPRITRLGRFLRKTRMDEIPQLWNVLKGDMSLVGPRPERPELTEALTAEIPFYAERENVLPGLTGWAQIRYPYGASVEDARRKLEYDLYYVKHMSLSLDLQIILSTLRICIFGTERSEER